MTVAVPASESLAKAPFRIDLVRPAFYALAAILAVLVVLPLAWLLYYAVVDKDGQLTLANFATLVTDATLRRPFVIAVAMALGVGALSCAVATPLAWLVARTDLPGRRLVRALVTASFVTPGSCSTFFIPAILPTSSSSASPTIPAATTHPPNQNGSARLSFHFGSGAISHLKVTSLLLDMYQVPSMIMAIFSSGVSGSFAGVSGLPSSPSPPRKRKYMLFA